MISDMTAFLAWALRTTPKKLGKMTITQIQVQWREANLPPAAIHWTDSKGKTTELYQLGDQPKRKASKKKAKSKPSARPKSRLVVGAIYRVDAP